MNEGPDRTLYRAVGIRRDGTRDLRAENLFKAMAEAVAIAMLASRQYRRVLIERMHPWRDGQ